MEVPFNQIYYNIEEIENITKCLTKTGVSSGGEYTRLCREWFNNELNRQVILTTSCTSALEMSALLTDIQPGDEIIMPSYTFVTTASAFVLRGGVPVFIDINKNTLNIDETLIEQAITGKTKAIVVMHYAGVACNMDKILEIAHKYNIPVIEDAAHSFGAKYKGKNLGCLGDIGCYSFHETKNITSGEGGALLINNSKYKDKANIISDKGTNRQSFLLGNIEKYSWLEVGSSFKMSDINAAVLYTQLKFYKEIQKRRLEIWNKYLEFFKKFEDKGYIKCPYIPDYCEHNAHIFYILFENIIERNNCIQYLQANGIDARFHYVPLHSSPAGKKYAKQGSSMKNTNLIADTLLRLPIFYNLSDIQLKYIFSVFQDFFQKFYKKELEIC